MVLRDDWESVKIEVMRELLVLKFSREPYKKLLLDTGNLFIQEGNRWRDTFWGVDLNTNMGENNLGILIMEIREELKKETSKERFHRRVGEMVMGLFRRLFRLA